MRSDGVNQAVAAERLEHQPRDIEQIARQRRVIAHLLEGVLLDVPRTAVPDAPVVSGRRPIVERNQPLIDRLHAPAHELVVVARRPERQAAWQQNDMPGQCGRADAERENQPAAAILSVRLQHATLRNPRRPRY